MKKFKITVDGQTYTVEVEEIFEHGGFATPLPQPVQMPAAPSQPALSSPPSAVETSIGHGNLTAPMPGTIQKVLVAKGEQVKAGQPVIVLEAMKMENNINAGTSGVVTQINVTPGESVDTGQLLLVIE